MRRRPLVPRRDSLRCSRRRPLLLFRFFLTGRPVRNDARHVSARVGDHRDTGGEFQSACEDNRVRLAESGEVYDDRVWDVGRQRLYRNLVEVL